MKNRRGHLLSYLLLCVVLPVALVTVVVFLAPSLGLPIDKLPVTQQILYCIGACGTPDDDEHRR